jgi:protein TonB
VLKIDTQLSLLKLQRELLVKQLQPGATAGPGSAAGQPVRVGGNIRPPTKTKHVDPVYPPDAQAERVQGVVIMEVTISETGQVSNTRVLRSVPLLDAAAIEAVRQWEFTPTLLNGSPVPVIMTVTVQFSLQ